MKKIGIKKEIDHLGRLCIPKEMRNLLKLEKEVELVVTPEGILIKNPEYELVKRSTGEFYVDMKKEQTQS